MQAILKSANIERHYDGKYDDPDWNSIFILKVHEALDLTGQVQETKYSKVKWIVIKQLLEE